MSLREERILSFFDEKGQVADVIQVGDYASGKAFFYRIAEPVNHSVIIRSDIFVFHETTKGPYIQSNRTDAVFAPWAPKESDLEESQRYFNNLLSLTEEITTRKNSVNILAKGE